EYRARNDDGEEQDVLVTHREELRIVGNCRGQPAEDERSRERDVDQEKWIGPHNRPRRTPCDEESSHPAEPRRGDESRAIEEIGVGEILDRIEVEAQPQQRKRGQPRRYRKLQTDACLQRE